MRGSRLVFTLGIVLGVAAPVRAQRADAKIRAAIAADNARLVSAV